MRVFHHALCHIVSNQASLHTLVVISTKYVFICYYTFIVILYNKSETFVTIRIIFKLSFVIELRRKAIVTVCPRNENENDNNNDIMKNK